MKITASGGQPIRRAAPEGDTTGASPGAPAGRTAGPAVRPVGAKPPRRGPGRVKVLSLQLLVVVVLAGLWQLLSVRGTLPGIYVSRPTSIVVALYHGFADGSLTAALGVTMYETVAGFAIATVAGILGGMALYESPLLERVSRPFLTAANNMPRLALTSLFVLWLGVGSSAHIVLVVTMVFFVVLLNTYSGFSSCDRDYLLLAKVLGASRWKLFASFLFPAAVPAIFVGLQLGLTYSFMGAVIGEIITGGSGLGALIATYAATYDSAKVFADLLLIGIVATALSGLIKVVESRLLGWRRHELRGLVKN